VSLRRHLGAVQALVANIAGVALGVALKLLGDMPIGQVLVLRSFLALGVLVPWAARSPAPPAAGRWLRFARAGTEASATIAMIVALSAAPVTTVAAIGLTVPLQVTVIGVLLLGERTGPLVWFGLSIGFGGALLVLQPSGEASALGLGAALVAALSYAARDCLTRVLPATGVARLSAEASVACLIVGVALVPLEAWHPVRSADGWALLAVVAAYLASNILVIAAVQNAGLILSGLFRYAAIPTALAFDHWLFGAVPSLSALFGTALIAAGGALTIRATARPPFHPAARG
jgi:drug/metabolite transporter (DMT)-like permease